MSYLLDTNVLIDFFHGEKRAVDKIKSIEKNNLSISVITVAEIFHGAYKTSSTEKYIAEFEQFLNDLVVSVIPLDTIIAKRAGQLLAKSASKSYELTGFDAVIAATVMVHHLTLVTSDRNFRKVPSLKIEVSDIG
jgi:predicted nucleic acid-binding protein